MHTLTQWSIPYFLWPGIAVGILAVLLDPLAKSDSKSGTRLVSFCLLYGCRSGIQWPSYNSALGLVQRQVPLHVHYFRFAFNFRFAFIQPLSSLKPT